eukprot:CAMPEP_0170295464 /NCGR_PEP_ID=MMETSP0116_2-20130129/47854_1 /TAXON_ID=400756 /ORGANISM="Durinskia baltica, Strain CSIRO CS-38" /LENGTH=125 /DNA_ID=CAMNT_0010547011 /DNA_START=453 /DNA_END=826 /DNA_ORIENTATION=-
MTSLPKSSSRKAARDDHRKREQGGEELQATPPHVLRRPLHAAVEVAPSVVRNRLPEARRLRVGKVRALEEDDEVGRKLIGALIALLGPPHDGQHHRAGRHLADVGPEVPHDRPVRQGLEFVGWRH